MVTELVVRAASRREVRATPTLTSSIPRFTLISTPSPTTMSVAAKGMNIIRILGGWGTGEQWHQALRLSCQST